MHICVPNSGSICGTINTKRSNPRGSSLRVHVNISWHCTGNLLPSRFKKICRCLHNFTQQKTIQLLESIFESLPQVTFITTVDTFRIEYANCTQVVLQSVFIIRSFNDDNLRENSSIQLVALSLAASLFSISNKYTWLDQESVMEGAKSPEWKSRCLCFNPLYALRVIWRFSHVATRFCMLSLVWSVLGGTFVAIFLPISFV